MANPAVYERVLQPTIIVPLLYAIQAALFITLLAIASVTDVNERVISNNMCALIALTGLIGFSPVKLFGILAALPLFIAAVCKEGSIGGGDIKMAAASGVVLGFGGGIAGLTIGLAAMLIFFAGGKAISMIRKKKDNDNKGIKATLPMAPFLSFGFIAVYILRNFAGF